uniref:Uncharacterized protein n=1 Tax=Chaetoceros debilis TaxID=122233 RepID=A0A7S3VEK4_9STRA
MNPTQKPTTQSPTQRPTQYPTTKAPSHSPTKADSSHPTVEHSPYPTFDPTGGPSLERTSDPTQNPTQYPTKAPTHSPTKASSTRPTDGQSPYPTFNPTPGPTSDPALAPTGSPSLVISVLPSSHPTRAPSNYIPSVQPSLTNAVGDTFDFPWFGANKNEVYVDSNGKINMDSNDDTDYFGSSDPNAAQFSRLGSQNSPRINHAFADLHPNYNGDIYVCQSSESVTVSYEEVEMYNQYKAQANVNSLIQLFPDGSINICYGESDISSPGDVCNG